MIFNMSGGSGVAHIFAIYPSGSVCECKKGSTVLTAPDTSGTAIFSLPSVGTWEVKITSGSSTASRSVNVTLGGAYEVRLMYRVYMVNNGVVQKEPVFNNNAVLVNRNASNQDVTESYCTPNHVWRYSVINYGNCHFYTMFGPYDISNAKQIVYDNYGCGNGGSGSNGVAGFGLMYNTTTSMEHGTDAVLDSIFEARKNIAYTGVGNLRNYTLDITNLLGRAYVAIHWEGYNGFNTYNDIRNLYIE